MPTCINYFFQLGLSSEILKQLAISCRLSHWPCQSRHKLRRAQKAVVIAGCYNHCKWASTAKSLLIMWLWVGSTVSTLRTGCNCFQCHCKFKVTRATMLLLGLFSCVSILRIIHTFFLVFHRSLITVQNTRKAICSTCTGVIHYYANNCQLCAWIQGADSTLWLRWIS